MANPYWEGSLATVKLTDVEAAWGQGAGAAKRLAILNKAFEVVYEARLSIKACADATQKQSMTAELDAAGDTGFDPTGVGTMKEACAHVFENNGRWKDNTTEDYDGGSDPGFFNETIEDAPEGAVKFLRAMEKRLKELASLQNNLIKARGKLQSALQSDDQDNVKAALEEIKKFASRGKDLLLFSAKATKTKSLKNKVSENLPKALEAAGNGLGKVGSYADTLLELNAAVDRYQEWRSLGMPAESAVAMEACSHVLGLVPIFGECYKDILDSARGFFVNFQEFHAQRQNSILQCRLPEGNRCKW